LSTLYIRLPSRAATNLTAEGLTRPCPYALVQGKTVTQQGNAPLRELSGQIAKAKCVVLLLAAVDVTLLRVKVPPLSPARLKAALPNLAEEHLIGDPADCAFIAGNSADGLRSVAVTQHSWLELLNRTLTGYGAKQISALPSQLCLPADADNPAAAVAQYGNCADLTLRLSDHEAIGLTVNAAGQDNIEHIVIDSLSAAAPASQVTLYVPQESLPAYLEAIGNRVNQRILAAPDNWTHWISGAASTTLDMMAEQRNRNAATFDWLAWRWPLALAAAVLAVNIAALNFGWLHMKREADSLRTALFQTYKSAYPNETVIIDPIAQMNQKIAAAKHSSGQAAPDDFVPLIASFGEAWTTIAAANSPAIAGFEYHDHALFVRLKPGGSNAPTEQIKAALALRKLTLEISTAQSAGAVWEIRSSK